jgi:flagellar hook-associated protein 1
MASLGSILSIANTALRASQAAVSVTAHNLANAETEGYSRQRAVLGEGFPTYTPEGAYGTGVRVLNVARVRDEYTNTTVRRETSLQREFDTRSEVLTRVESLLGEPGEQGISAGLDAFFSAWSELSTNPTSGAARTVLRDQAVDLTERFQRMGSGFEQLRLEATERLEGSVNRINSIAESVAGLNRDIVAAETGGNTAGDLRDARDRLLDELSTLTPISVTQRDNGSVGVLLSGVTLVDGAGFGQVGLGVEGGQAGLVLVGRPGLLPERGGTTGALLDLTNRDLPEARATLDLLASSLVADVNALHRTGTNRAGDTDLDFFDPAGVTSTTLRLSAAVRADAQTIAAGTADGLGNPRPGANDVALSLAALRDGPLAGTGETPGATLRTLVSQVGVSLRSSLDRAAAHTTLADQAELQRASISGVSTDEEMTKLIRFQAAYAAAARIVTVADEMMESILRM